MPNVFHAVSGLYGLAFAATAMGPAPSLARCWGWLLLAVGYWAMAAVPERVWRRPFERKFRDGRWVLGHSLASVSVLLLFTDLVARRLFG